MRHIHDEVLDAANRIASQREDWTFTSAEVVAALRHLNEKSVRTHVGSRCCINAPRNHPHKWDYFRRVRRGLFQVRPPHRRSTEVHTASNSGSAGNGPVPSQSTTVGEQIFSGLRDTLHFVVYRGEKVYVAEGVDLAAVTQGSTLDEVLENVKEVVALYLEGEDAASLGLVAHPRIQLLCEIPPVA